MKFSMKATIPIIVAGSLCIPLQSHAYLGGFEANDNFGGGGYLSFVNWVNGYNAGEYGSANGGPGGVAFNPLQPPKSDFPTGLWDDKNNAFGTYNANPSVFMGGYYVTGHGAVPVLGMVPHSGDQMLALRNTSYATPTIPAVPLDYRYTLDTRDFYNGGNPVKPADTGSKIVDWSVWAGPGPVTAPNGGVWLSFVDSDGDVGFEFGWDETYELRYRDKSTDGWTKTGYVFGRPWAFPFQNVIYDQFHFSLDLENDDWSLDVFSTLKGNAMTFVTDRPFGQKLDNFTNIDFHVSYGNEKGFFDDSEFVIRNAQVPERGTFALVGLAGLLLWRTAHAKRRVGNNSGLLTGIA